MKKWYLFAAAALVILAVCLVPVLTGKNGETGSETTVSEEETAAATVPATETEEETETETETVPATEPVTTEEETAVAEETQAYVSPVDFESLAAENPDVIAWIHVDDTRIDYPVYQSDDNEYYLHHDPYGNETTAGSIFLDCDSSADFVSRNNILYGHHMKNGSMFKDVMKFRDEDFFKTHPYFTIYTPQREIHLKAVACYYAVSDYELRRNSFTGQYAFDRYVEASVGNCSFAEPIEYPVKAIYSLVTCSYEVNDARTILIAVEVDEDGNQIPPDEAFLERIAPAERAVLAREVNSKWNSAVRLTSRPELR